MPKLGQFLGLSLLLFLALAGQSVQGLADRLEKLPSIPPVPRVNAPHFSARVPYSQRAIFWFGQVDATRNHTDVRVGYNDQELVLTLSIFDQHLWYDASPAAADLTNWDAATLYLNLDGNTGEAPGPRAHRFIAQVNHWQARESYQAAHQGDGGAWIDANTPFTTTTGWRGDGFNQGYVARGWTATYRVPFASLGRATAPASGTIWGLALSVHDRDDLAGTTIPDQSWPPAMAPGEPATWGQLHFGLPTYSAPPSLPEGVATVRHKLAGAAVPDAHVGGHTVCGSGLDFWTEWGEANYAGFEQINIQNQSDVADWPCFSRYYVTFPLDLIPAGKSVISATLTLHQFGNAGAGYDPGSQPSLIQVLTVAADWDEATVTWNNAPLAWENVAATWGDPLDTFPGWPGAPWQWDVSRAVAQAYAAAEPLRLALYSADSAYHSGKYFVSSDTGDWNAQGRPTLRIGWGDPVQVAEQIYLPLMLR